MKSLEAMAARIASTRALIARTHALAAALAADSAGEHWSSGPNVDAWRARYAVTEMVALIGGGS